MTTQQRNAAVRAEAADLTTQQRDALYSLWIHQTVTVGTRIYPAQPMSAESAAYLAQLCDAAGISFSLQNIVAYAGEQQKGFAATIEATAATYGL